MIGQKVGNRGRLFVFQQESLDRLKAESGDDTFCGDTNMMEIYESFLEKSHFFPNPADDTLLAWSRIEILSYVECLHFHGTPLHLVKQQRQGVYVDLSCKPTEDKIYGVVARLHLADPILIDKYKFWAEITKFNNSYTYPISSKKKKLDEAAIRLSAGQRMMAYNGPLKPNRARTGTA
jgi:hypothetical protein